MYLGFIGLTEKGGGVFKEGFKGREGGGRPVRAGQRGDSRGKEENTERRVGVGNQRSGWGCSLGRVKL